MIPVPQRIVGSLQAGQRGDCYKCCIASILELPYEDVPHFAQGEPDSRYGLITNLAVWIREHGWPLTVSSRNYLAMDRQGDWDMSDVHSQYEYEPKPRSRYDGYWIATVKSRVYPQSHHAIVMNGMDVVFDPSPSRDDPKPYEFCGEDILIPDLPAITRQRNDPVVPA